MPPRRSRPETTRRASSEKLAISLPRDLAVATREAARAAEAPSVSAFIAGALEEKLKRDRLQEVLDEIFGDQPMTDEERAWVDQYLFKR